MDRERWDRIKEIFSAVIALGPDSATDALLSECSGEEDLLEEVRPLVEEHFRWVDAQATPTGSNDEPPPDLSGILANRFRVTGRLGAGSFGDVYRVIDEAKGGEQLALKVLRSPHSIGLQYFKREFRSLSGINHRNLVALHELIAHNGRWMFSMECIDGVDLLEFLNSRRAQSWDEAVRSSLMQLSEGLRALHERHLLHRDLKPSNVMVTSAGRVVLLDFGLVRSFAGDTQKEATFAGTPSYMSPEQAAGTPLTESSDWYAVGVMLYQILTGRLPFHSDSFEAFRHRQFERPAPPIEIVPGISPELNELCLNLLEPDPLKRARYGEVVRLLSPAAGAMRPEPSGAPFIGRDEPLQWLSDAYALAENRPVLVHLRGPSGIGKTALLREWMRRMANQPAALVFSGCCYEGESVPFQAIDDLIDHIAQHLRRLRWTQVERYLPRNFGILVKMFPVLYPFLSVHDQKFAHLESLELRTRAFSALRELMGRFAEHHRVILVVDDLQWGDADGCAALRELLSAGDSPPILVVLAYRSEDIDASSWLEMLRETAGQPSNRTTIFIHLDQLEPTETTEFAQCLLAGGGKPSTVEHVVQQSGGNPFLVHEMVRWIHSRGPNSVPTEMFSLADVVRSRVEVLAAESRHLLELLVVAGQPTELATLQTAAGIRNVLAARDELVAARLIRLRSTGGRDEVEVYHDRIRTTITAELDSPISFLRHREMASALERASVSDPERIALHYQKAREPRLCAQYSLQAARRAVEVLAFHKASAFFEMALAAEALEPADRYMVHRECADALANAGRGPEAAEHYLAAGAGAGIDEQLECDLLAAEQLLFTGHIDRGLAIFKKVLGQVGLRLPKTTSRIPLALLFRRSQLRILGLRWREISADNVPRNVLLKVDTCASAAIGLSLVDIARGATLQTTSLLLALRAGEPSRVARALAMEAAYRSTSGLKAKSGVARLIAMADELSSRTGDRRAIGLTATMFAACAWNAGLWEECYRRARAAREALYARPERVAWERDTASIFEVEGLRWMGRWSRMKALLPGLLEDARLRGDLYAQAILQMHGGSCAALANDDPDQARAGLAVLARWSNTGFHVEHLVETHNQVEIALYVGDGAEALSRIRERWPALRESLLLRVQTLNIQMQSLQARAAILAASDQKSAVERRDLLRLATRASRAIERQGAPWGRVFTGFIQGGIESLSGKREQAIGTFQRVQLSADSAGMFLHSAVARRSQGLLIGGDDGRALAAAADRDLASEGIVNPERLSAVIAPGLLFSQR